MSNLELSATLALGAGIVSFLSPCTLPLFPAYLSYITGVSVKDLLVHRRQSHMHMTILIHSIVFLLGLSVVYFSLGIGVSVFGQWLQGLLIGKTGLLIQRLTGILLIVTGLVIGGWLTIPILMKQYTLPRVKRPVGMLRSFFVGFGFSASWTPCIGPIFTSILLITGSNPTQGLLYTSLYIIGFSLPFLISGFFLVYAKWLIKYSEKVIKVGGVLIIIYGLLLFSGQLTKLSNVLLRMIQESWFSNLG